MKVFESFQEFLRVFHGGETTSLKKLDNTTLQKPSKMLSYGVGHAAKIGGKNPIQNFPSNKGGLFYDRWWWKMKKIKIFNS